MSATLNTGYSDIPIDEYIDGRVDYNEENRSSYPYGLREGLTPNTPIINVIMENGIQPKSSNKVLTELYPKLFDGCLEYMKKNKRPILYIHREENKPEVWNLFIMSTNGGLISKKTRSARTAIRKRRQNKFVYVGNASGNNLYYGNNEIGSIKYYFKGNMTFFRFKKPELIGEIELPF